MNRYSMTREQLRANVFPFLGFADELALLELGERAWLWGWDGDVAW